MLGSLHLVSSCTVHSSVFASLCETTKIIQKPMLATCPSSKSHRKTAKNPKHDNLIQLASNDQTGSYIRGPSPFGMFWWHSLLSYPKAASPSNLATSPQNPHLLTGVWQSNLHQAVERRPIETMETRIVSRCEAHVKPWQKWSKIQGSSCWKCKMTWKHIQS